MSAYCWGKGSFGVLGNAGIPLSTTPVAVSGGLTFASVWAGGPQTCGLTTSGAAYCWRYNKFGQLGNGTLVDRATPVLVLDQWDKTSRGRRRLT